MNVSDYVVTFSVRRAVRYSWELVETSTMIQWEM